MHVTLLPWISGSNELKTKPTQHSVRELRGIGIQPDMIVCRSDHPMSDSVRQKLALFTDVEARAVVPAYTVASIYEVPLMLESEGVADFITERLSLPTKPPDLTEWQRLIGQIHKPKAALKIALGRKIRRIGRCLPECARIVNHAAWSLDREVDIQWTNSELLERPGHDQLLDGADGILVPGGFGLRGVEGKIAAARYARLNRIPYLACAWACRSCASSSPATCLSSKMPTAPNSIRRLKMR